MTDSNPIRRWWRSLRGEQQPESVAEPLADEPVQETSPAAPSESEAERRWRAGTPVCLLEFLDMMMSDLDTADFMGMRLAMAEEYANQARQALDLFFWYGHGQESWTDFPAYETVPEQFLMEMGLRPMLDALQDHPLDSEHLEAAARFFSGELFRGMRGPELELVPEDIRQGLTEHVAEGGDVAKIDLLAGTWPAQDPATD